MKHVHASIRVVTLVAVAATVAAACGAPPPAPDEVTKRFWQALHAGDVEAARLEASAPSAALLDSASAAGDMGNLLVGETLRNEQKAIVRTSMTTIDDDVELNVVFNTHLVLEDEQWKVDVGATQDEVVRATFAAGMKLVGEAIGQGIEDFGAAMEQGAAELKEAIRDAFEGDDDGDRL